MIYQESAEQQFNQNDSVLIFTSNEVYDLTCTVPFRSCCPTEYPKAYPANVKLLAVADLLSLHPCHGASYSWHSTGQNDVLPLALASCSTLYSVQDDRPAAIGILCKRRVCSDNST